VIDFNHEGDADPGDHECDWEERPAGIVVLLDLEAVRRVRPVTDNVDRAQVLMHHAETISTAMQHAGAQVVADLIKQERP